jgi:hypothetical protein
MVTMGSENSLDPMSLDEWLNVQLFPGPGPEGSNVLKPPTRVLGGISQASASFRRAGALGWARMRQNEERRTPPSLVLPEVVD